MRRTRWFVGQHSEVTRPVYVHGANWLRADIVQTMAEGRTATCMRGRSSAKQLSTTLSECVRQFGEPVHWLAYRPLGGGATSLRGWGVLATAPYNGSNQFQISQHLNQITTHQIKSTRSHPKDNQNYTEFSSTAPAFTS